MLSAMLVETQMVPFLDGETWVRITRPEAPRPDALPLFVRIVDSLETTSTFKSRKVDLRNQAYGPEVSDPLYVLQGRDHGYVPFYSEYPAEVAAGRRPEG